MNNYPDYSPFKLLEPYGAGDTTYFFGREKEIIQLNDLLIRSKFVLLYGASGTGKTSLIQCGMSGMYSPRDWYPLFIRRNDNFIDSIHAALFREYQNWNPNCTAKELDSFQNQSLRNQLKTLFAQSYRPIYLILDQFEEIFTLSLTKAKEAKDFFDEILKLDLFREDLFCKIIIACREEYIAHFYNYEKTVPFLFEHRFRLEKMRDEQMLRCIQGIITTPYAGYPAMHYAEQVDEKILSNLKNTKGEIELTELQIYLDRLYREDVERVKTAQLTRAEIVFDDALVGEESLNDVMNEFLDEQLKAVSTTLSADSTKKNLPLRMLFKFVTAEGTKKNLSFDDLKKEFATGNTPFSELQLQHCLTQLLLPEIKLLNRLNLTAPAEERYEIMHDRMAACLQKRLGGEEEKERQAKNVLNSSYLSYAEEQKNNPNARLQEYLSVGNLALINETLNVRELSAQYQQYIEASKQHRARQKLTRIIWLATAAAALLAIGVIGSIAFFQAQQIKLEGKVKTLVANAKTIESQDPVLARTLLNKALQIDPAASLALLARKELWVNQQFYHRKKVFPNAFHSLAASVDGKTIVATYDETLFLLGQKGQLIDSLRLDTPILAMRLNRQADGVFFTCEDQKVYVWHFTQSKPQTLGRLDDIVYGFDYHPTKDLLAVMDGSGILWLWQQGEFFKKIPIIEMTYAGIPKVYPDHTLAFNADGNKMVSGTYGDSAIIFDLNGQIWRSVQLNKDFIQAVDYSPVKDEVLTCSRDGQVHIWDASLKTKRQITHELPTSSKSNQNDRINFGKFSGDGTIVLIGYTNNQIQAWYVNLGVVKTYLGHGSKVVGASWLDQSRALLSIAGDSSMIWWKLASRAHQKIGPVPYGIGGMCYVPERNELFLASGTGELDYYLLYRNYKSSFRFPDTPQYIHRWHVKGKNHWVDKKAVQLAGVKNIICLNKGNTILCIGKGSNIYAWNLNSNLMRHWKSNNIENYAMCAVGDQQLAVVGKARIEIWSVNGDLIDSITLPKYRGKINCIAWNPVSQQMYLGLNQIKGSGLYQYIGSTWKQIEGFPFQVVKIAFSPNGHQIAVGTNSNRLYYGAINNAQKAPETFTFSSFSHDGKDECNDLAFSPDGKKLAIATKGSKAIIFDLTKKTEALILSDVYEQGMFKVLFSPDGKSIYSGGGDGWVYVYKIPVVYGTN